MKQSLDGGGWRAQYFRPKRPLIEKEFEINNLLMDDGEASGASTDAYDDSAWFQTVLPVDVRDILVKHGVIPDPYWGRNSDATGWVAGYEWWFRKRFQLAAAQKGRRVRLVFRGVDLLADYYLNGNRIGSSNDMFVSQVFEVTDHVRFGGENLLAVKLHPQPKCSANHFWGGEIPRRARYHKAQLSWGWDWSREMVSMGIWDEVYLETANTVFLDDLFLEGRPQGRAKADLHIRATFNSETDFKGEVAIDVAHAQTGQSVASTRNGVSFKCGDNEWTRVLPLRCVQLWHPNGYGKQPLYRARMVIRQESRELTSRETVFGIREIRMLPNTAAPDGSYNLVFSVNGTRIFAMGANWVPADLIFSRVTFQRYESLVKQAAAMGFNMLRVWGGGLIEKDAFYDCCDRHGILVWQDFPLACANYPKDRKFVHEKTREADAVIRKLRNHPCLALYCGGNELFYYGETSRSPVLRMFKEQVAKLHPAIDYHYSSPDKEREGERDHGPWTYQEKHHAYWNRHFRNFASELGCNACLNYGNFRKFLGGDDIRHHSPVMKHHFVNFEESGVAHSYGGLKQFRCESIEDRVFASQLIQADTLAYIMGKYRSYAWRSSGVLFWQYNSAWPEGGWSIIDYYGTPKLACYFLREMCGRKAIHVEDEDWELHRAETLSVKVHLLGDGFEKHSAGEIDWSLLNEAGKIVHRDRHVLKSGAEMSLDLRDHLKHFKKGYFRLKTSLKCEKGLLIERNQFYALGAWKDVKIKDLRKSVAQFVRTRFPV